MGHLFIVLDPQRLSAGAYDGRMATLLEAIEREAPARLPGSGKVALRERAAREGLAIPAALYAEIRALIGTDKP